MNHFCNPENGILLIVKPMGIIYVGNAAIEKLKVRTNLYENLIESVATVTTTNFCNRLIQSVTTTVQRDLYKSRQKPVVTVV
jgi:hypothetical protein